MQNFQDIFETRKPSFIRSFSICMTVPLTFQKVFSLLGAVRKTEGSGSDS